MFRMVVFFLSIAISLSGCSIAHPLYGSTSSLEKSSFCKRYKCEIIRDNPGKRDYRTILPTTFKNFAMSPEGYTTYLIVDRDNKHRINNVSVYFPDGGGGYGLTSQERDYLVDLVYLMVGVKYQPLDFLSDCAEYLLEDYGETHHVMARGKTKANPAVPYVIYCQLLSGGNPNSVVDDSVKFVISDAVRLR